MNKRRRFLTSIFVLLACSFSVVFAGDYIVGEPMRTTILQALTGSGNVLPLANGGTGAATASGARTNLGVTASSSPRVIPSALSLGTAYELLNNKGIIYLALKRYKDFSLYSRSYTISAGTENGWTKDSTVNLTNLSALNENVTTAGALRIAHKAAATAYSAGVRSAPFIYKTVQANAGELTVITARVKLNGQGFSGQQAGIIVTQADALATMQMVTCGYIGGVHQCEAYNSSNVQSGNLGAGTLSTGVWLQLTIRNGVTAEARYSTAVQSTPPNNWSFLQGGTTLLTTSDKLFRFGIVMLGSASGTYTLDVSYFDTRIYQDPMVFNGVDLADDSAAQGYDATSPAIQLITDWDIGATGTPSQSLLRSVLAGAVNPLHESRTTATWTFSAVCSDSPGASPGAYASAASMVLNATGRYCNLWAKATSDGYYPATLDINSIFIPVTP